MGPEGCQYKWKGQDYISNVVVFLGANMVGAGRKIGH